MEGDAIAIFVWIMGGSSAAQPIEVEYQVQAIQWTDAHWWEKNSKISSYRKGSRQTFRLCALGGANFLLIEGTDFHTINMQCTHAGIGSKPANLGTNQGPKGPHLELLGPHLGTIFNSSTLGPTCYPTKNSWHILIFSFSLYFTTASGKYIYFLSSR